MILDILIFTFNVSVLLLSSYCSYLDFKNKSIPKKCYKDPSYLIGALIFMWLAYGSFRVIF